MAGRNPEVNFSGISKFKKQIYLASCTFQLLGQSDQHEALQILLSLAAQLQDQLLQPAKDTKVSKKLIRESSKHSQQDSENSFSEQYKVTNTSTHVIPPIRSCSDSKILYSVLSVECQSPSVRKSGTKEDANNNQSVPKCQILGGFNTSALSFRENTNLYEGNTQPGFPNCKTSGKAHNHSYITVETTSVNENYDTFDSLRENKSNLGESYKQLKTHENVANANQLDNDLTNAESNQINIDDSQNSNTLQEDNIEDVISSDHLKDGLVEENRVVDSNSWVGETQALHGNPQNVPVISERNTSHVLTINEERENEIVTVPNNVLHSAILSEKSHPGTEEDSERMDIDKEKPRCEIIRTSNVENLVVELGQTLNSETLGNTNSQLTNPNEKRRISKYLGKNEKQNTKFPKKILPCAFCHEKFPMKSLLYVHLSQHAKENTVVCTKCGTFCEKGEAYQKHIDYHKTCRTQFKCEDCSETFILHKKYLQHVAGHKQHICPVCNQTFINKTKLMHHKEITHGISESEVKCFECKQCPTFFISAALLKSHQLSIHTSNVAYISPPIKNNKLNKHIYSVKALVKNSNPSKEVTKLTTSDEGNKPHLCTLCGSRFTKKQGFERHMQQIHSENRPFKCPHCDFHSKNKTNLKRHVQLHTDKPRFVCELCGTSFRAHATLKEHHMYVHSELRKFSCSKCDKTFKSSSAIRRHVRVHLSFRPYECDCGQSYKRMSHLRRHMLASHGTAFKSRRVPLMSSESNTSDFCNEQTTGKVINTEECDNFKLVSITETSIQNEKEIIQEQNMKQELAASTITDSFCNEENATVTLTLSAGNEHTALNESVIQHFTLTPLTFDPDNPNAIIDSNGNNFTLIPPNAHLLTDPERIQLIGHTNLDFVNLPEHVIDPHGIVLTSSLLPFEEARIVSSFSHEKLEEQSSCSDRELLTLSASRNSHLIAISEEGLEQIWTI